jgi:hypothetical protein
MVASILIIGFSVVLLVYWFRYSCLLLLRNNAVEPELLDQRFGFARVQQELQAGANIDPLYRAVERDYRLLTYLIEHAAGLNLPSLEDRLLVLDYRVVQCWYRLMRIAAPEQARHALAEMASVVGVLVQHMSDQAGIGAQA